MRATRREFVVNLKNAKNFGLTIPQTLLATAEEVIHRSDGSPKTYKNLEAGLARKRGICCLVRIKEALCAGSMCGRC